MVLLALPGDSIHCLSSDRCVRDAWCRCHDDCFFLFALVLVVVVVCIDYADSEDSCHPRVKRTTSGSCAGQRNVAVCDPRASVVAIDALVAIIVIVG